MPKVEMPKRGRKRTTLPLPAKKELYKIRTKLKANYGLVRFAKEANYNPAELARAMKDLGLEIQRGPKPGSTRGTQVQA